MSRSCRLAVSFRFYRRPSTRPVTSIATVSTRVIDLFLADGVNGFTALGVTSEVARLTDGGARSRARHGAGARQRARAGGGRHDRGGAAHVHRLHARARGGRRIGGDDQPAADAEDQLRRGRATFRRGRRRPSTSPIIVQDYPPISGFAMEPALLARIARDVPAARRTARTVSAGRPTTPPATGWMRTTICATWRV